MRARPRRAYPAVVGPSALLVGAVVALCLVAGMFGPPAGATPGRHVRMLRPVAGVTIWRHWFSLGAHRPERTVLMRVDLSPGSGVHVDAAAPREMVGGRRRTVVAQANLTGAVAGINADWFDMETSAAVPRGAFIRSGRVLKTPRPGWRANLFVRSDGSAGIGAIPFAGAVTAVPAAAPARRRPSQRARILSINTPYDAAHGHIVYVTHGLYALGLHRRCTVVFGHTGPAGPVVSAVHTGMVRVPRVRLGHWALVACGGIGAAWLRGHLAAGRVIGISLQWPQGKPAVAVSGGRVLVHDGEPFVDVGGQRLLGPNPETFACVSRSGRSLLLGVVDGRSRVSDGMTQQRLSSYLMSLHCWDGMTFDGGGSSIMVARSGETEGAAGVSVLNRPSDGRPRPVADGLYVYAG